jgi:hypothetical protein
MIVFLNGYFILGKITNAYFQLAIIFFQQTKLVPHMATCFAKYTFN